jgi:DNA-binding response OmpR family regulator
MQTRNPKILVIEDEIHLMEGLSLNLELEGYAVFKAPDLLAARQLLVQEEYFSLLLLDIMLPDGDGFSLCSEMRQRGDFTPIIMLTARSQSEDRILGLESGADDYITKPFDLDELLARVRSLLRRQNWNISSTTTQIRQRIGRCEIDLQKEEIYLDDVYQNVTTLEYSLLTYFILHSNRVVSRQELLREVWKMPNYPNTRTIDNFIMRLRRLIERDPTSPEILLSIRGRGYILKREEKTI